MSDTETVPCIFCGPADSRVLPLLCIPNAEGDLVLRKCAGCGLIYQSPRFTQEKLRTLFDDTYFEKGGYSGLHHARSYFDPEERAEKVAYSHEVLADLEASFGPARKGRLLEVGAAGGHFLLAARERGWDVAGVEISDYAVARARELYGLDLVRGQLEEAALPGGAFDVVYLNDLLEHAKNPLLFLGEVRRILREDGMLYALVPTYVRSVATRVMAPIWDLRRTAKSILGRERGPTFLRDPFHIYEFTPRTLALLYARADYDVISMQSSMPSVGSGPRSSLGGIAAFAKLSFLRFYARGVRLGVFWGEKTRVIARPRHPASRANP
ncbi:MAG: class I SAM-dependent methyltransferase [Acidobacteriota bacterium]